MRECWGGVCDPLHQVYGLEWHEREKARACERESEQESMKVDEKRDFLH